jgi:hypothetical protein
VVVVVGAGTVVVVVVGAVGVVVAVPGLVVVVVDEEEGAVVVVVGVPSGGLLFGRVELGGLATVGVLTGPLMGLARR